MAGGSDTLFEGLAGYLYLLSGTFTSTIKDSEDVSGVDSQVTGINYDSNTDTPWTGSQANKLYLQSGHFTSTVKTSQDISSIDVSPSGVSFNGTDTLWTGIAGAKYYKQSGEFTSTLKTSQDITSIATYFGDLETSEGDVVAITTNTDYMYLTSGEFTTTVKDSEFIRTTDNSPQGISWNGTNTPWSGATNVKLYLQSGQFTSTIKTSQDVSSIATAGMAVSSTVIPGIAGTIYEETLDNTITFDNTIYNSVHNMHVDNAIYFWNEINGLSYDLENSITFDATIELIKRVNLNCYIYFDSEFTTESIFPRELENDIYFTVEMLPGLWKPELENDIIFTSTFGATRVHEDVLDNDFLLEAKIKRCYDADLDNTITFAATIERVWLLLNMLELSASIEASVIKKLENSIIFETTIESETVFDRTLSNDLGFTNIMMAYLTKQSELQRFPAFRMFQGDES